MRKRDSVYQMAFLVEALEPACLRWAATTGAGPFFLFDPFAFIEPRFRGLPADPEIAIALGFSGDLCIELIEVRGTGPSVFEGAAPGQLHHVARLSDDIDRTLAELAATGAETVFAGRFFPDTRMAFVDTRPELGCWTEVIAYNSDIEAALARLHESDARMAAVAEQLGHLGSAARSAAGEADRLASSVAAASAARDADQSTLTELEARLTAAEELPDEGEPSTSERDRLAEAAVLARQAEVEARLAVRTGEERVRALAGRAEQLERAAVAERAARVRSVERRRARVAAAAVATAAHAGALATLARLEVSLAVASAERDDAEQARTVRDGELLTVRGRTRELQTELEALVSSVHRDEMARAEQRLRIEQLELKAMDEFGIDAETLVTEYGPDVEVPPSPYATGDEVDPEAPEPQAYPYVRAEQEKRCRSAERSLALLGKVNPLALEEFSALEERHRFLNEQLDDLKRSRTELLTIITDVDERVKQVFAEAYADVEREFERIFSRLFPGGEGRLILTDPDDLLTTGIEVEARPPGKKVKRLSLLSGGERSLTAVAFLVALFKARPSPFYIMDEVEAALDDVNLQRLLGIMEELREDSQLIVITHQKRTMEIADALYGVSMRGDGVTTVIGQRLRGSKEPGDIDVSEIPVEAQPA